MRTAERAPEGGDILTGVDDRTIRILEHRQRTGWTQRRGWLVRRTLVLADVFGLSAAFVVAQLLFSDVNTGRIPAGLETLLFFATIPGWVVIAKLYGLYSRDEERTDHSTVDDLPGVFHLVTVGAWVLFAGAWLTRAAHPDVPKLVTFWGLAIGAIVGGRAVARAFCRRTVTYLQNTVIVGTDEVGQLAARKILRHREYGINLVGFVDREPVKLEAGLEHLAVLGAPDGLPEVVRAFDIERVIIAFAGHSNEQTLELIRTLKDAEVQVDIVPRLFELVSSNAGIHTVEGLPLVSLPPLRLAPSSRFLKRAMDVTVSLFGLVVLVPLFAVIALLIKLDSPGPAFFRQVRMGARDKTFEIVKFRTMAVGSETRRGALAHLNKHAANGGDARMFKAPDDPRVTRFGRFLRRYSLDELPQLVNVLKGEMSLVGPRPLPLEEDRHVGSWARRRLDLRPGITGPWQVLGRSDIPFEEMVKLDYLYVTGWSLGSDLKLLARTVPVLFNVRGAY